MVVYERFSDTIVRAYSDKGLMIRGGFPEGVYAEAYDPVDAGRTYVETDEYVPTRSDPPFRTFSKLKLEGALFSKGVLDAVDAFIDSQTITNEYGQSMPLRRKYETAVDFSEAHPLFKPAVSELQRLLGWTDEQVEEVLSESVKDKD